MAFSFLSNISLIENSITSLCLFLYHPIETDTGKGIEFYYILKDLKKKEFKFRIEETCMPNSSNDFIQKLYVFSMNDMLCQALRDGAVCNYYVFIRAIKQ